MSGSVKKVVWTWASQMKDWYSFMTSRERFQFVEHETSIRAVERIINNLSISHEFDVIQGLQGFGGLEKAIQKHLQTFPLPNRKLLLDSKRMHTNHFQEYELDKLKFLKRVEKILLYRFAKTWCLVSVRETLFRALFSYWRCGCVLFECGDYERIEGTWTSGHSTSNDTSSTLLSTYYYGKEHTLFLAAVRFWNILLTLPMLPGMQKFEKTMFESFIRDEFRDNGEQELSYKEFFLLVLQQCTLVLALTNTYRLRMYVGFAAFVNVVFIEKYWSFMLPH
eukprot:gene871-22_t